MLLGVADALKARAPAVGVDLLFVDGEDFGDFADSQLRYTFPPHSYTMLKTKLS